MSADILPPIGLPPSIELVPPARLNIDASYQRSIESASSQRKIAKMTRAWDWRLCVPLLVSRRPDGLYVIDGQHRKEAAQRRGDIPYLPCCVSEYASPADEAAIFVEANSTPQKVHRVDAWRAAVLAGDADALAIDRVVRGAELQLVATSLNGLRPGQINALDTVSALIKAFGEPVAARAFAAMADSFPGHVIPSIGTFARAVAMAIKVDKIDHQSVAAVLAGAAPYRWIERAKNKAVFSHGGGGAALALREVIRDAVQGRLPAATPVIATAPRPSADHAALSAPPTQGTRPPAPGAPRLRSFEEQLAAIERGEARAVDKPVLRPADPDMTLGGVGSAAL